MSARFHVLVGEPVRPQGRSGELVGRLTDDDNRFVEFSEF